MRIHELSPNAGSRTKSVRIGRGIGSGIGKTAGKGHKGQNARSGGGVRLGFEGGQIPLVRRIPIRGFNNANFKKQFSIVNVGDLEVFEANTVVTEELLVERRIVGKKMPYGLKVLGTGDLTKALVIKANKFSTSALDKIIKAGGKPEVL